MYRVHGKQKDEKKMEKRREVGERRRDGCPGRAGRKATKDKAGMIQRKGLLYRHAAR